MDLQDIGEVLAALGALATAWAAFSARREVALLKKDFAATKYPVVRFGQFFYQWDVSRGVYHGVGTPEVSINVEHLGGPAHMRVVDIRWALYAPETGKIRVRKWSKLSEGIPSKDVQPDSSLVMHLFNIPEFFELHTPVFLRKANAFFERSEGVSPPNEDVPTLHLKLKMWYTPAITGAEEQMLEGVFSIKPRYNRTRHWDAEFLPGRSKIFHRKH